MTGKTYGRLTAIEWAGSRKGGGAMWRLRCECGNTIVCDGANVRNGRTKSCGCLKSEGPVRHGLSHTTTHNIWVGMKQRCLNQNAPAFRHYGGRGIGLCDRWHSFDAFLADMGEAPAGMTIERVDNEKGYEPHNCVWADQTTQVRNRRITVRYTHDGETLTLKEWADRIGVPYAAMWHRYSIGKRGAELMAPLRVIARGAARKGGSQKKG